MSPRPLFLRPRSHRLRKVAGTVAALAFILGAVALGAWIDRPALAGPVLCTTWAA